MFGQPTDNQQNGGFAPQQQNPAMLDNVSNGQQPQADQPQPGFASSPPQQQQPAPVQSPQPTQTQSDVPVYQPPQQDNSAQQSGSMSGDQLLHIKQEAMQKLEGLVDHIDVSPEEKFKTTMMMVQANDNPDLLGKAYEAAQDIMDDKVRADALLDVINEVNYFTQMTTDKSS